MNFMQKFLDSFNTDNKKQRYNIPVPKLSVYEAEMKLQKTKELASIANKTTDREEFYSSIDEIKAILSELSKYEGELPFIGSPSADLRNLEENKQKQIELLEKRIAEKNKSIEMQTEKETTQKINCNNNTYQENIDYRATNKELDMFDIYLVDAGRFLIDRDKASIGMIQRAFKIGFNQAARIMDKLNEMGVVGEELGTKPREILVTRAEYEKIVENYHQNNSVQKVKTFNYEQKIFYNYESPQNAKIVVKEKFGIESDYSNDGKVLKKLKNIIIPSVSNEIQIESINTLLKYNSPETMRLILIDDSIINYSTYNGVSQLLIPVVTETNKIDAVINWCSAEMGERIKKFVDYGVKNIESYNEKVSDIGENILPRIIIIANEAKEFFDRTSKPLERMLMNSNMVGLYFILFSRFSLKNLSLGIMEELLEVFNTDKLRVLLSQTENTDNKQYKTRNFDDMDGHQFERFCADILRKNGFKDVEVTQGSGDHGIDILAEKDGITYAIQCKCYSSDIGNSAVQQAHTGKSLYHKDIAVVITNRHFTPQAVEEAKALGVKLWDRDKLNELTVTAF